MGSENTKSAERILKFLKKHPPTLVMGSEISKSAHVFLKKYYFSKIQLISPSTSLMGSHREHFGENFSKFIILLFWWGRISQVSTTILNNIFDFYTKKEMP